MGTDLLEVADALYGLPPTEFTAARDEAAARAKLEGQTELARQIRALRKPVAAAWAVNLLVRRKRSEVERLFTIADRLREAQRAGEGAELRELNRAAQAVVPALVRLAGDLARSAERPITEAVAGQVHQTLRAAMADPTAAAAVLSGRMIGPLEATGGESVDVAGAVAIPTSVTSLAARAGRPAGPRAGGADRAGSGEAGSDGAGTSARAGRTAADRASADRDSADRAAEERAAAEERRNERRRLGELLADREDRLAQARSAASTAAEVLTAAKTEAEDLDHQRDELRRKLRQARALTRSLEDELEGLDADRAAADRSRRTLEDRAARAERRAEAAAREVDAVRAELSELGTD